MTETPWALVQRRRAEGLGDAEIAEELVSRGVAADDVEALLPELGRLVPAPTPEPRPFNLALASLLRWSALAVALVLGVTVAVLFELSPAGLALGGVFVVAALVLLAFEFRAGPRRTARRVGTPLAVAGAFSALVMATTDGPGPVTTPLVLAGAAGGALALCGFFQKEALKRLDELLPGATVFEVDGVQFVIVAPSPPRPLGPGEQHTLSVFAQCVVSARRHLRVDISPALGEVLAPPATTLSLEPGVIVEAAIGVTVGPNSNRSRVEFNLDLRAGGTEPGVRLLAGSGAEWVGPGSAHDQLATNVLGVATLLTLGAGTFQLEANKNHLSWLVERAART